MPARGKGWGWQKPPFGTPIDWSNPISQGLVAVCPFSEGGGLPYEQITRTAFTAQGANPPTWAVGPGGIEGQQTSGVGGWRCPLPASVAMPLTVGCVSRALTGNNGSYRDAFGLWDTLQNNTCSVGWSGTTATPSANSGSFNLASGSALTIGVNAALLATFKDTSTKVQLYVNGVSKASSGSNASAVTAARVWINGTASGANLTTTLGLVWNRVLSADEIAAWSAAPFDVFVPPRARRRDATAAAVVYYPGLESWFPDRPPASPTVAVPY